MPPKEEIEGSSGQSVVYPETVAQLVCHSGFGATAIPGKGTKVNIGWIVPLGDPREKHGSEADGPEGFQQGRVVLVRRT